ncbi:hypothetical protein FHS23_002459 [Prauserella isguenensis]|uniref:Uncharacterized protein n=1 Tax=Prauserella isguenensis TaxID=1470180 RepID=A0A839S103_9PSEU|nr:hypothetical protein [Prauserella isguenensis]
MDVPAHLAVRAHAVRVNGRGLAVDGFGYAILDLGR